SRSPRPVLPSLHWGAGSLGLLAILRFPVDARHPVTQTPYGAYAVGEVFPLTYQGQPYEGRVIERQVSRAEGLVELHVLATCGEEGLRPAPTPRTVPVRLSRQERAP